jgi:hypothetical protein
MKYALVCPNEFSGNGYRVAQIETNPFPVALPTYWVECDDAVVANQWYFDPSTQTIIKIAVE